MPHTQLAAGPLTDPQSKPAASSSHHANDGPQTMSDTGFSDHSRIRKPGERGSSQVEEPDPSHASEHPSEHDGARQQPWRSPPAVLLRDTSTQTMLDDRPRLQMRLHFEDFAAQLRAHRHQEHTKRMLEHRRRHLQKAVALATRLHRVGSWVHDGLVEIAAHKDTSGRLTDPSGFVRVHQHMHDLVDVCFSRWNKDIRALDPVNMHPFPENLVEPDPFLVKLTPGSRAEALELIHNIRSNPRFLIDRFRAITPARLSALSTNPRFKDLETSILTSLSQNRGRSSQKKRVKSYSKILEDYATSFERSNPLSFLLFNCFGPPGELSSQEDQLRLSTWSSICAGLYHESPHSCHALINQILNGFALLHGWRAKDQVELFLMGVLQRGAFLLEMVGDQTTHPMMPSSVPDALDTEQAREFFNDAIKDLLVILCNNDGGFPLGAFELGCAVLEKVSPEMHSMIRGQLSAWFFDHFLQVALQYPENEKMLLQFHISKPAREHILTLLSNKLSTTVHTVLNPNPSFPVDRDVEFFLGIIITKLAPKHPSENPHLKPYGGESTKRAANPAPQLHSSLAICAADVIQFLEAIGQQAIYTTNRPLDSTSSTWDIFLESSQTIFNSQSPRVTNKFDKLRRELVLVTEPGLSSAAVHPCHENWILLAPGEDGKLVFQESHDRQGRSIEQEVLTSLGSLDIAQTAATRLLFEDAMGALLPGASFSGRYSQSDTVSLAQRFSERAVAASSAADAVESRYWTNARKFLLANYPMVSLANDDSRILRPMILSSLRMGNKYLTENSSLEAQVKVLENAYAGLNISMSTACLRLDRLKIKLWYDMAVTSSNDYEDAKNVSDALNYMALSTGGFLESEHNGARDRDRAGTSTSTSSLFDQPRVHTMSILKAPREHGGPRKLADAQIELTRKWLDRNGVENFCKGEERIHRFCMEVKMATKKLVGEDISESPVLWSSELWAREKAAFDVHSSAGISVHGSSRAPSIMSETLSSTFYPLRPGFRTEENAVRSIDADIAGWPARKASFHSLGSNRTNREQLGIEVASSVASPVRSLTTTTATSISSLWSPLPPQSRSGTSISWQSRPASIYNDLSGVRLTDIGTEKSKFLEILQHELTCLLLSDIGNPLWSYGSETDAWMDSSKKTISIDNRLRQREVTSYLLGSPKANKFVSSGNGIGIPDGKKRSASVDDALPTRGNSATSEGFKNSLPLRPLRGSQEQIQLVEESGFQKVLNKIGQQVDPNLKLQSVHEFKQLALLSNEYEIGESITSAESYASPRSNSGSRRKSIGPGTASVALGSGRLLVPDNLDLAATSIRTEGDIVERLKNLLLALEPKTIFRDLQYIAAFVPSDILNKTEAGRAFLHLGLAALACKDEICRSMVDLADRIVAKDSIKRMVSQGDLMEQPLIKAREYWLLAAREGNAIAQRELAGLYLAHPEVPPIVSRPLALSSEIFKNEMMWETRTGDNTNTQALCLALHWMQQAADNGDQVAQLKLRERDGSSIH